MAQTNTELAESLHQFVTIWKMIGRPFPHVDQMDRPGLAITWPATDFPFYNALFLTEQLTDAEVLQDRVQAAAAYMRARSAAQRVWGGGGATCPPDSPPSDGHQ